MDVSRKTDEDEAKRRGYVFPLMGLFRVTLGLKTSLRAKPFIRKCVSLSRLFSCKPKSFSFE